MNRGKNAPWLCRSHRAVPDSSRLKPLLPGCGTGLRDADSAVGAPSGAMLVGGPLPQPSLRVRNALIELITVT